MRFFLLTVGLTDDLKCLKFKWENKIKARDEQKLMTRTHPTLFKLKFTFGPLSLRVFFILAS
jgi:hypothetical protein